MKLSANPFENSAVCKGVGYAAEGASMDMAKIELTGRYPGDGTLALIVACTPPFDPEQHKEVEEA